MDISRKNFVGRYFYLVVTIFPKNRAILVQKLGEEKNCQNPLSGHLKTKKKSKAL